MLWKEGILRKKRISQESIPKKLFFSQAGKGEEMR